MVLFLGRDRGLFLVMHLRQCSLLERLDGEGGGTVVWYME